MIPGYEREEELWNRARASVDGIQVKLASQREAVRLRFRCYQLRSKFRKETKKMYAPNEEWFGKSPWDEYTIWLEGQVLKFVKNSLDMEVKEL